jgi:hypothetical protein
MRFANYFKNFITDLSTVLRAVSLKSNITAE